MEVDEATTPAARVPPPVHTLLPLAFIGLGALLRLSWPMDFEWKADEQWMFDHARAIAEGKEPWPWQGMPSSVGIRNPGLSVWPFALLARVLGTPAALTQGLVLLNIIALLGFALWIRYCWPPEHRTLGYWAVALFAVSPLPILHSRKLWAQDVLPVFGLPWLWGHSRRDRGLFSFLWGFSGALLGQLHMSGFFAAAGLALSTGIAERKSARWIPWLAGSFYGALPMAPWLYSLLPPGSGVAGERVASMDFYGLAWKYAWGLGLDYSLGGSLEAFMSGPTIGGIPLGLVRYGILALAGASLLGIVLLWRDRKVVELPANAGIYFGSVLLGGMILQLTCVKIHPFYLIAWSPLLHLGVAWVLFRRRPLLVAVTCLQLLISCAFLVFIHRQGGAPNGDFGVTYERQMEQGRSEKAE